MKQIFHQIELYVQDSIHISAQWYWICLALFLVLFCAGLCLAKRKKLRPMQAFCAAFLAAYLLLIIASVIICRAPLAEYKYQLRPFWSYAAIAAGQTSLWRELAINVAMFVPVGALLPLTSKHCTFSVTLLSGFCIALLTELLQLLLRRGMFETDDIFHNLLGILFGYALYRSVVWLHSVRNRYKNKTDDVT